MDNNSSGLDIFTVTFLIFMALKLMGYITWSWWWVTAPIWIPFCLASMIVIFLTPLGGRK